MSGTADAVRLGAWLLSTAVHAGLVLSVLTTEPPLLADPSTAAVDRPVAAAADDATAAPGQEDRFISVPERVARASIPDLEPTSLPPLPGGDLADLADAVAPDSSLPTLPTGDALPAPDPPAAAPEPPGPTHDGPSRQALSEAELARRYQEFAAQISNRLIRQWLTAWQTRFRHRVQGDSLLLRITIRDSAIRQAEGIPGESSGDPLFDRLLLRFINEPAAQGRPLNALAVPDRVLEMRLHFR